MDGDFGCDTGGRSWEPLAKSKRRPEPPLHDYETKCSLPKTPGAAEVIAQRHGNEHKKSEETGSHGQFHQSRTEVDVHEEQNDQHRLDAGDQDGEDRVECSQVDKGCSDRQAGAKQQRPEDQHVGRWRDNVMVFMFRGMRLISHGVITFSVICPGAG
jgi:hypothetical protein